MTYSFKRDLLHFIYALHCSTSYSSITEFHALNKENLPELRTIYRWQKEMVGKLEYYPSISFDALGLKHVHLFIKNPSPDMLQLPFAVEMHWLVHDIGERVLYIHGLVPSENVNALRQLLPSDAFILITTDGRQFMQPLQQALDHQGRLIAFPCQGEHSQLSTVETKNRMQDLGRYPLIIPVIFENYGKRKSLEELWKSIRTRLGDAVWQYIPNGNRKLLTNGKAYVKRAFAVISELGLFQQVRICYAAFLDEALEVLLVMDSPDLNSVLQSVQQHCLVAEAYPGTEGKHLLRLIGNHHLIYALMGLSLSSGSSWYFLDKNSKIECRFRYEELFDVKSLMWHFPVEAKEVRV